MGTSVTYEQIMWKHASYRKTTVLQTMERCLKTCHCINDTNLKWKRKKGRQANIKYEQITITGLGRRNKIDLC